MTHYEHLQLPKVEVKLPKKPNPGFGKKESRSDRASHGTVLLNQVSALSQKFEEKERRLGINPKLIFKIKLRPNDELEKNLPSLGLHLLAKEPKAKQAIVVFADDDRLSEFQNHLNSYAGLIPDSPQYGYLDDVEALVPLEPEDRKGPLLKLDPLKSGNVVPLDMELWHTGERKEMDDYINAVDEFLRQIQPELGMRVSDRYIGNYICIVRIQVTSDILEILLQEYQVKEIDRRPKPAFESPSEYNIPLSSLPEILSPDLEATGVLVIDSGVQRGHPLIGPTLGDSEVFPDPKHEFITGGPDDGDTTGGHGTGVAGIAIYGDIGECVKTKLFQPQVWLFSARVTNEKNQYDPELLLDTQIEAAIDYFVRNYPNCKVINISLGDSELIYQDGEKQFRLAARIDEIAYRLQHKNIIFVISAGNFWYDSESPELIAKNYPNYLLSDKAQIIEPATAAIALTVGSLSMGKGSGDYPNDARRRAISKVEKYPSPFTRTGFGVDGMIKPELVEFGGDFVLEGDRVIENDFGAAMITLKKDFQGSSLFKFYNGTSFSAPRVANLAAQLFNKFPHATSNLIRALIADSAQLPTHIPTSLQGDSTNQLKKQLKIYGYGKPDFERAAYSRQNQVLLIEDNEVLSVGTYQIYEIPPLPEEFIKTKGTKTLSITLAFDPPSRHTRGDSYLGITMEFHLFRNIDKKSLNQAFADVKKLENPDFTGISIGELKKKHGSSIEIELRPNLTIRKKGTLQKGQVHFSSKNWKYDYNPMYLVVACNKKWVNPEETPSQRYAIVASISHSEESVDLYNQIRLQNRASQRLRI
ncbi:MAG: S8 family peptidase [Planktothrix sp.]